MRIQLMLQRAAVSAVVVIGLAGAAFAEEQQPATEQEQTAQPPQEDQTPTAVAQTRPGGTAPGTVIEPAQTELRDPYWDFVGGYEGDHRDTSFAFLGPTYNRPISENVAITGRVQLSHLHYEFANGDGGLTEVTAPGISPAIGLRFGRRNWVRLMTGVVIRRESREVHSFGGTLLDEEEDTEVGLSLGADAWLKPSRRSDVHAMLHYGAASSYTWARVAGRHQVSNFDWRGPLSLYLGAEVVGQGNDDLRSFQVGPVLELSFGRSELSLQVRGGYKHSSFDVGEDESGAYFGLGLWKRL